MPLKEQIGVIRNCRKLLSPPTEGQEETVTGAAAGAQRKCSHFWSSFGAQSGRRDGEGERERGRERKKYPGFSLLLSWGLSSASIG